MSWKDILKETIGQNRVKEIEDINIDIEDDDCLRWLEKLYNIILKHPEGKINSFIWDEIKDEETACYIKDVWQSSMNYQIRTPSLPRERFVVGVKSKKASLDADLTVIHNYEGSIHREIDGEKYSISLKSATYDFDGNKDLRQLAIFASEDREKTMRVVRELCNYLGIKYDFFSDSIFHPATADR